MTKGCLIYRMIPICKTDKQQGPTLEHREIYSNLVIAIMCVYMLSHVQLFVTQWTIAHQALLSTGFPKQEYWEYWSELPLSFPGDFPHPVIKSLSPTSSALSADSLLLRHQGSP